MELVDEYTGCGGGVRVVRRYVCRATGLNVLLAECTGSTVLRTEIVVPTMGTSDKGEPHCLEHMCFKGSANFPLPGFLDSFCCSCLSNGTNAYTAADRTVYELPCGSVEGLRRILPVFLEHIHFPTLSEEAFLREVFHIDPQHENAGVVYSEMESMFSEPLNVALIETYKMAYPQDCNYRHNVGGNPACIPSLTLDEVRRVHHQFYHAQNTTVVIIGDITIEDLTDPLRRYEAVYAKLARTNVPQTIAPWRQVSSAPAVPSNQTKVEEICGSSKDHFVSVSFRLNFEWADIERRLATDIVGRYLTEGPAAPLNQRFVLGKEACAGGIEYCLDNVRYPLLNIFLPDVEPSQSQRIGGELRLCIDAHMRQGFNLSRLRKIVQKQLWQRGMNLEAQPHKAIDDMLVSYTVNCDPQCTKLADVLCHLEVYEALLAKPEDYWVRFITDYFEKVHHYVVVVMSSPEKAEARAKELEQLSEQRKAANVPVFDVTALDDTQRKQALLAFTEQFEKENNYKPIEVVDEARVPKPNTDVQSLIKTKLRPVVQASDYQSSYVSLSIGAELPLAERRVKLREKLNDIEEEDFREFVLQVVNDNSPPDVSLADLLYNDPTWDQHYVDDDRLDDDEDIEMGDADDISGEDDDDTLEIDGHISEARDYVFMRCLKWVLANLEVQHIMPLAGKCLFNADLRLTKEWQQRLKVDVDMIPSEVASEYMDAVALEYNGQNGFETSHSFNTVLAVVAKMHKDNFSTTLTYLACILDCIDVSVDRLVSVARQELSSLNDCVRQGEPMLGDIQDLLEFGMSSVATNQSYLLQAVLLRCVLAFPELFVTIINDVLRTFNMKIQDGECMLFLHGHTRILDETVDLWSRLYPRWVSEQTVALPEFPAIASMSQTYPDPHPVVHNLASAEVETGHIEVTVPLPDTLIPPECRNRAEHQLYRHDGLLCVVEEYLRAMDGPLFQPVRDSGAAYSAGMSFDEEARTVTLELYNCTQPLLALTIARDSLQKVMTEGVPHTQFQQAKCATLYQWIKDLESLPTVAEAQMDSFLRRLPLNEWRFAEVTEVSYEQFREALRVVCEAMCCGQVRITAVSPAAASAKLAPTAGAESRDYHEVLAETVQGPVVDEHTTRCLVVLLKARMGALVDDDDMSDTDEESDESNGSSSEGSSD